MKLNKLTRKALSLAVWLVPLSLLILSACGGGGGVAVPVASTTAPGSPTAIAASAGNAQASVSFTAPASNGGSAITGYTVTSIPAGGVDGNAGSTALSHTITGLTNGLSYVFTVKATNAIGTSAASLASNAVTPLSNLPGAPTAVTAVAANGQATVSFTAPSSNGGFAITGYAVTSIPTGGVDSNAGTTALSHTITGLTNGTSYTFTVKASNVNGSGAASLPSNAITPMIMLTNGQAATVVIGQPNFTSNAWGGGATGFTTPLGPAAISGSQLYIAEINNNRLQVFNSVPTTNGASAAYALGQPNLTTYASGVSATTLNRPAGAVIAGGKLFIADSSNNRVAIYNTLPTGSPGTMDVVVGQVNKTSNIVASAAAATLYVPASVAVAGGKMVVADANNNRVLIWNSIPTVDGTAANLVLGQPNFTSNTASIASASTLAFPTAVWTDGTRLVVNDFAHNRVLIWNTFPTINGQPADLVLGQPNFTSSASGVSATSLNAPETGVFVDAANQLFVTDSGNNRVLVWNTFPATNGQAADRVLGQPNFTSNTANASGVSATSLSWPSGVYVSGTQVFVSDASNNRVLIY